MLSNYAGDVKPDETTGQIGSGVFYRRAINILIKPKSEWDLIAREKPNVAWLIFGYLLILSFIPFSSAFVGFWLVGKSLEVFWFRDFNYGLALGLLGFAVTLATPIISAVIIKSVYPVLKVPECSGRVMQLTVYSMTPVIVASVFFLIPYFRFMAYIGGFYGIVVIWYGTIKLLNAAKENHLGFFFTCTGLIYGVYYVIYMITKIILDAVFLPSLKEFARYIK